MKLEVAFTPAELGAGGAGDRTVIVVDVLRATSTVLEALVNGAQGVIPAESVEAAVSQAQKIGREYAILCGERDGEPIAGFDLGNSPLEFTRERVAGKTLVMTTTNGTRALIAGGTARNCYVGSLLNASAAADVAGAEGDDVLILCAGRENRFALEDALCAGIIVRHIRRNAGGRVRGNDAAHMAAWLAVRAGASLSGRLKRTAGGRNLARLGRSDDVEHCARLDRHTDVPIVKDRRVTLTAGTS